MTRLPILLVLFILVATCSSGNKEAEVVPNKTDIPPIPVELKDYTLDEIGEIHQFINVDRWNRGGDIGMRFGTDYTKLATISRIPTSELKAIDDYYHYEVKPALEEKVKKQLSGSKSIMPDMYHPVQSTAYCGLNTFYGQILVKGDFTTDEVVNYSSRIAEQLTTLLPNWITGFKVTAVKYVNPVIETESYVGVGYVWKQGGEIKKMNEALGTRGYMSPQVNTFWETNEWYDQQEIPLPVIN